MARGRNSRLKKADIEIEYTPEQIQEVKRCLDDPVYFMRNYVYIKHPELGQILFDLFDYQEIMVRNFQNNRFCINLLPRQVGKTECISAYLLWFSLFNTDKTVIIASNKGDSAMEIISKIQNAYEELPVWLKPGIDESAWNKHSCTFDNKSRILSFSTAADTGRTFAVSLLYCDEFAFVQDHIQDAFWTSIYPTLSNGGRAIISSTPNGDINKFAELWRGAELGTNPFHPFTVKWNARPGRDEKFKEDAIATLGSFQKWLQEYECHFISSDHTLINSQIITDIEKTLKGFQPAFYLPNNNEDPQPFFKKINRDSTYLVGVDPGNGGGNDFTVIEVVEFPSMEQVMEYRTNSMSHVEIYRYLKRVLLFLEHFAKEVYWSVENNGVGQGVIALYEADEKAPQQSTLISDSGKNVTGMFTTDKTKMEACLLLKNMFESKLLTFYSPVILKELKNYKRAKGAYEAKKGATDDCIAATLIILRMLKEIALYDTRAYHALYTINLGQAGDEWVKEVYKEANEASEEEQWDENEVAMPVGLF